jgi:choline dehydrogenase
MKQETTLFFFFFFLFFQLFFFFVCLFDDACSRFLEITFRDTSFISFSNHIARRITKLIADMQTSALLAAFAAVVLLLAPIGSVVASPSYDYIVVGGGTAGCVAAARLSENPRNTVLLIEPGRDDTADPLVGPVIFPGKPFVDIYSKYVEGHKSHESQPNGFSPHHYFPVSRTLGGGSQTNGQCYSRMPVEDLALFNISGWSYDDVLPFQKRVESYTSYDGVSSSFRGMQGPVSITNYAPGDLTTKIIQSMSTVLKMPIKSDLDSGDAHGVSQFGRNSKVSAFTRESSWSAYLKPVYESRRNLKIMMNASVTKIKWATTRVRGKMQYVLPLKAEGVYYTINSMPESSVEFVEVNKEVLLAAGTINSPKLLMLSGIGPAQDLASKGIEVVLDSPHVGQNLHDHMKLPTMTYLFVDAQVSDRVLPVAFGRTGMRNDNVHDFEIAFVQAANGIPLSATLKAAAVVSIPVLTRNSGNGSVTLLNNNPTSQPVVEFRMFGNPRDALSLAWLGNVTRSIAMNTPGFIAESAPGFAKVPLNAPLTAWMSWFQSSNAMEGASPYYHFTSTCKMSTSIQTGVVDNKLKLHGSSNVRVIDMSVLPQTTSVRPFGSAMMLGERGAEFALTA